MNHMNKIKNLMKILKILIYSKKEIKKEDIYIEVYQIEPKEEKMYIMDFLKQFIFGFLNFKYIVIN